LILLEALHAINSKNPGTALFNSWTAIKLKALRVGEGSLCAFPAGLNQEQHIGTQEAVILVALP
jgi:hypothetical protein